MYKKILLVLLVGLFSGFAFGQVSVDPDHKFYENVQRWENLGIIPQQSVLRPYSLLKVQNILDEVASCDNEKEAETAQSLYEEIFDKKWHAVVKAYANYKMQPGSDDKQAFARFGIDGDAFIFDGFSTGYQLNVIGGRGYSPMMTPHYVQSPYTLSDTSFLGPILGCLETDASLAYQKGNFSLQAGINRVSLGLFLDDGLAISNNARHTANFSLTYDNGFLNFTEGMLSLTATTIEGESGVFYPNKYLMFHNVGLNFNKKFSLGFYEVSIFGNRFDPAYFIPVPYLVTEGVTGFSEDNVLMGGTMALRPVEGLTWKIDGFLDDFGISKWSVYHDIKLRCSGRTSLEYIPANLDWFNKVSVDYTAVTPYMYTHVIKYGAAYPATDVNYQVYNNAGRHLGTALEPNSDRINLNADFTPVKGLKIGIGGTFIRHGNVNENLSLEDQLDYIRAPYGFTPSDGSIQNHSFVPSFYPYRGIGTDAWNQLNFLVQDTKEYTIQANLNAEYDVPGIKLGKLTIGFDYTFEFIKNYGVSTDMFGTYLRDSDKDNPNKKVKAYTCNVKDKDGEIYTYVISGAVPANSSDIENDLKSKYNIPEGAEIDYSSATETYVSVRTFYGESDVKAAIDYWKSQLTDLSNHYFTIKFIYRF